MHLHEKMIHRIALSSSLNSSKGFVSQGGTDCTISRWCSQQKVYYNPAARWLFNQNNLNLSLLLYIQYCSFLYHSSWVWTGDEASFLSSSKICSKPWIEPSFCMIPEPSWAWSLLISIWCARRCRIVILTIKTHAQWCWRS